VLQSRWFSCLEDFEDFGDLLERISTYSDLIIGDINRHLNVLADQSTIKFQQLTDVHDLTQHIVVPTHSLSHTFDVLITRAEKIVNTVRVDPPTLSDHSQIVGVLAARLPHSHTGTRQVRRCWRQLHLERLKCDVLQSTLVADPPVNVDDFFCVLQ